MFHVVCFVRKYSGLLFDRFGSAIQLTTKAESSWKVIRSFRGKRYPNLPTRNMAYKSSTYLVLELCVGIYCIPGVDGSLPEAYGPCQCDKQGYSQITRSGRVKFI